MLLLQLITVAALASTPTAGQDCGGQVCLYASASTASEWKPGARLSAKQRKKEAKKNRKRKEIAVAVDIVSGRGSVFLDGRYLATAGPHAERAVKPGKHELEVRDGGEIVAAGVLSVSRKAGSLTVVIHADRPS